MILVRTKLLASFLRFSSLFRRRAKFLKKKSGRLVQELEMLAKIVLPHLDDEETMGTPDKTVQWWLTENDLV
ncbi:hypothetical protein BG005_004152, partial [Podila minutissima]